MTEEELRGHIGKNFVGISTSFICHDGKGKILLGKRAPSARDEQGRWDPGAGSLEFGLTVEENIRKEIMEEYCVEALKIDFLGYFDVFRNINGHNTHWLALVHAVQVDPKKVSLGEPHKISEIGWFSLENLPNPMHSQFENFMNKFGDNLNRVLNGN